VFKRVVAASDPVGVRWGLRVVCCRLFRVVSGVLPLPLVGETIGVDRGPQRGGLLEGDGQRVGYRRLGRRRRPLTVGMWTTMTMTGGVDGASLKIGAKSFTEEALLAAITKIELGNLKYEIDFRSVYQTLIRDWLQGDAATVLGATYPELPFINKA
jgi:hypothetical protein